MRIAILLFPLLLAGCSYTGPVDPVRSMVEAGEFPANYRALIVADAVENYFDPYSIRSAEVSEPFLQNHVTLGHFWAVCVKSNGKNRMGGYVGIETDAYVFRGGSIVEKSTHPETYCGSAVYAPFPELEAIG